MIPRSLPYFNFILASSSLAFQLGVLYPWHITLDNAFTELQQSHKQQLSEHIKLFDSLKKLEGKEGDEDGRLV